MPKPDLPASLPGWLKLPLDSWTIIRGLLPKPWQPEAVEADLVYWSHIARLGIAERPGRRLLAKDWGWNDRKARTVAPSRLRPAPVPLPSRSGTDEPAISAGNVPLPSRSRPAPVPVVPENPPSPTVTGASQSTEYRDQILEILKAEIKDQIKHQLGHAATAARKESDHVVSRPPDLGPLFAGADRALDAVEEAAPVAPAPAGAGSQGGNPDGGATDGGSQPARSSRSGVGAGKPSPKKPWAPTDDDLRIRTVTRLWADAWNARHPGQPYPWNAYRGPRLVGGDRKAAILIADTARIPAIDGVERQDILSAAIGRFFDDERDRWPREDVTLTAFARQASRYLISRPVADLEEMDMDTPF